MKKSKTTEKIKEYKARVERKHRRLLQCLHFDNGSEYVSKEFSAFLTEK